MLNTQPDYPPLRDNTSHSYHHPPTDSSNAIVKSPPPPIPSKPRHGADQSAIPQIPPIPPKQKLDEKMDVISSIPSVSPNTPDSEHALSTFTSPSKTQAVTEGGSPLRIVVCPAKIMDKFLELARPNTNKNLETCGILSGTLKRNILIITTLIIPKQTATSDTCTTEHEEEFFDYQDKRDLMTLGWIHVSGLN